MLSIKQWFIMNVSLGILVCLLSLNLLGFTFPSAGEVAYRLDKEEPLCFISWKEEVTPWNDLDRCCLQARQQLSCKKETKESLFGRADRVCQTGTGTASYRLNNKAYHYCQQQAFW
ncbi:hypothetical protein HYX13_00120 [Candidatus Woesearchaeota archaeon]|nr:hypothetical protein [Candidatus Woesearchaeota archaeon]